MYSISFSASNDLSQACIWCLKRRPLSPLQLPTFFWTHAISSYHCSLALCTLIHRMICSYHPHSDPIQFTVIEKVTLHFPLPSFLLHSRPHILSSPSTYRFLLSFTRYRAPSAFHHLAECILWRFGLARIKCRCSNVGSGLSIPSAI